MAGLIQSFKQSRTDVGKVYRNVQSRSGVDKLVEKSVAEVERAVRSVETELVPQGRAEVEQTLLRFGFVQNKKMNELIAACKEGRADVVQELLEKFEPSQRDDKGWSPLHYASQYGHKEIVELLLQRGCFPQIETRDRKLNTPLHLASTNGHEDVVRCLLEALPAGEPLRRNKEGNNPLHLACKVGNTSIVHVLREYSPSAAYEANSHRVTPFGFALSNSHLEITNLLLEHAKGNPAVRFKDFATQFPSFEQKRSLDFPVKLFVVGDHRSGKSTLIKSLQVVGLWDRFWGVSMSVPNVDQHKAGLVPSDFSSRSFGRVIFYDLASGPDFIHEDMIQSADDVMHSAFIICINLKEERKEMESRILYWMNFIYNQCASYCSPKNKPNVTVVGTFSEIVKPFRLVNPHRLHLSYSSVIASHPELSAQFNLLRKYCILDCRKPQTPSMDQLRSALKKLCQKLRPMAVEIQSRCYVLSSVLATEVADTSVVQLWELAAKISSTASKDKKALCNLLPQTAEELLPLCQLLQLRCRVTLLNRSHDHNIRSTWIIHRSHRLITILNNALSAAMESSETSSSPALIKGESLWEHFTLILLDFDLLLHLLEHFKIYDSTMRVPSSSSEDDQQLFYFPSLLPREHSLKSCDPKDSSYSFQFSWVLIPTHGQDCQFFMPRFLKLLLLSLLSFSTNADFDSYASWSSGIYCCSQNEVEICVGISSKAIILNMRCKHDHEISCLQLRNQILKEIRVRKESIQPGTQTEEYIVPKGKHFPLKVLKSAQMKYKVADLKGSLMKSDGSMEPDLHAVLYMEPYIHLRKLSESHRCILTDSMNLSKSISHEVMSAIAKCFKGKWAQIAQHFDLRVESDPSTDGSQTLSTESDESPEGIGLEYEQLLECLSSISIFESSGLKQALEEVNSPQLPRHTAGIRHSATESPGADSGTPTADVLPTTFRRKASESDLSQSSSDVGVATTTSNRLGQFSASSTSVVSYISSENAYPECLQKLQVVSSIRARRHSVLHSVPFVDKIEVLQCDSSGGHYSLKLHEVEISIPEGAISENTSVHLEIGVTLHGPFEFPKDMKPVSPIVWLGIQEGIQFTKSTELSLPHFINCVQEGSHHLSFLTAQVKAGEKFQFQKTRNPGSGVHAATGTLRTRLSKHPCFICIAAKVTKELTSRANYCVIKAAPKSATERIWKAHFCITYLLPTCIENVQRQFQLESYNTTIIGSFNFEGNGNLDPSIEIHFERLQPGRWILGLERARKIRAHEIDFWNVDQAQMKTKERYNLYPPRFTIEVNGERAESDTCAEISFSGVKEPQQLQMEIILLRTRRPSSHRDDCSSLNSVSVFHIEDEHEEHLQQISPPLSCYSLSPSGLGQHRHPSQESGLSASWPLGLRTSGSQTSIISAPPGIGRGGLLLPTDFKQGQIQRSPAATKARYSLPSTGTPTPEDEHILVKNMVILTQSLNMSQIRPYLRQLKVITEGEHIRLLDIPDEPRGKAIELLIYMVKRKGPTGLGRFITALEKTAEQDEAHKEILQAIQSDPGCASYLQSQATHIRTISVGSRHSINNYFQCY